MKKLTILVLSIFSTIAVGQIGDKTQPHYKGKIGSVEYVAPMMSRMNDIVPFVNTTKEAKDKRSIANQIVVGQDPQTQDDYFVRNRHPKEQSTRMANAGLVFDTYSSNSQPTDPSLAIGPNHVFVVFNTGFMIYDKSGNQLLGETAPNPAIFPSGGCCDLTVSYDNAADRWVLSFLNGAGAGAQIAISDGANPLTSGWYVYNVPQIADYQKLSVWRDGYYITENTSGANNIWALERDAMLTGDPNAQILGFSLPGIVTSGFFSPQVLNITDDNIPSSGGAPIVYMQDNAWSGVSTDHIKVWTANVNWSNPSSSGISNAQEISVTPFIGVFDGGGFSNLSQPNGGATIDALQATIMNQAQFRKFATHNSAVFNFVVDTDASSGKLAGIRWMEFRQSGDGQPWSLYQEGTYTAPDGKHAWNASIAMDGNGNIGMGYTSMSGPSTSSTVRVSSYFTGRLSNDPLNTMTAAEGLIANGNQNIPGTRYGDYSKVDVDPSNDKTFWFITEYMNSGRKGVVGTFEMDGNGGGGNNGPCTAEVTAPYAESFETSIGAWTQATNDDINWTRNSGTTPSSGTGPSSASNGTFYMYVEASGNGAGFPNKRAILNSPCIDLSGETTANFNFDYHMFGATVGGRVDLEASTDGTNWTSLWNAQGNDGDQWNEITVNLDAYIGGTVQLRFNRITGGTWQSDVAIDNINVTAGGSTGGNCSGGIAVPYSESYETSIGAWTQVTNDDIDWTRNNGGTPSNNTGPSSASNGTSYVYVEASGNGTGFPNKRAILNSPCLDLSGEIVANFSFDYHMFGATDGGRVDLEASTDGINWTSLWNAQGNDGNQWNAVTVSLDAYAGGTVQLRFNRITGGTWQSDVAIDNINLTAGNDGGGSPPTGYCSSNGQSTADEYISRVQLGSINNSTGAETGGYGDYTSISTNLSGTNTITVTPTWTGTIYAEGYAVWIDYNRDGDFADSGELVWSKAASTDTPNSGTFTVPATASTGATRMRVSMKYNGIPTACESFQYGEVENYTVTIGRSATRSELLDFAQNANNNIKLSPNPATSQLNIEILEGSYDEVAIFSTIGKLVYTLDNASGIVNVDVSQYAEGTYFVRFVANGRAVTKRFIKQ